MGTRPSRRTLLATLLVVVPTAGCADDGSTTTPVAASSLIASGVGVVAEGCPGMATEAGSGIVLDAADQVVTVAHTIAGATDITVIDHTGAAFAAQVVAFDHDSDLAVLDVPGLDAPPLSIGTAARGPATAVVWSRDDGVNAVAGDITRLLSITIEDIYIDNEVQRLGLELAADIESGDSGGGVINAAGDVVGIIYARSLSRPGVAFATSNDELARLLDDRPLDATDRCT